VGSLDRNVPVYGVEAMHRVFATDVASEAFNAGAIVIAAVFSKKTVRARPRSWTLAGGVAACITRCLRVTK
jgi:hypothetical protein